MVVASLDVSIVVPAYNEEESLPELLEWVFRVVDAWGLSCQVVVVDDGSTDGTWSQILQLVERYGSERVWGIRFRRNYGKSAALHQAFACVTGRVVITMDADLQDSPDEIPALYQMIVEQGYDLVSGWKQKRYDPLSKTLPTKLYNWVARRVSGIPLHDFNCGLKAYRLEVVKSIEVYGEMHRYIPLIAKWQGFRRIGEKVVVHRPRRYGVSKFGWERFINGPLDLLSITFVGKFGKRPMHFFGSVGAGAFLLGAGVLLYLSLDKLLWHRWGMTDRPLFYFGIVLLIVGTQLFLAGFLAEMLARLNPLRNHYQVEASTRVGDEGKASGGVAEG